MSEQTVKVDEMVREYLQLRDEKERLKREMTDRIEPIDEAMKQIEIALQRQLQESGLTNFGTKFGTVYVTPKTFSRVADWNILIDYVKRHDAFDILTKNVSKDAILQRINETGEAVPGIDLTTIQTVGIRRK